MGVVRAPAGSYDFRMNAPPMYRATLLSLALGSLLLGCGGGGPLAPLEPRLLEMDISLSSASGGPGEPIVIRATVTNRSRQVVWHLAGCVGASPTLYVWEIDRRNVEELCGNCPNVACPACVATPVALAPGKSVTLERTFEGQLWKCDGPYDVAAGDLDVELSFTGSWGEVSAPRFTMTRSARIHWTAAVTP